MLLVLPASEDWLKAHTFELITQKHEVFHKLWQVVVSSAKKKRKAAKESGLCHQLMIILLVCVHTKPHPSPCLVPSMTAQTKQASETGAAAFLSLNKKKTCI